MNLADAINKTRLLRRVIAVALTMSFQVQPSSAAETTWKEDATAGTRAFDQGNYAQAAVLFDAALKKQAESGSSDWEPDTVSLCSSLGMAYELQGRYKDAEPPLKRALELSEKRFGPEQPAAAKCVRDLGTLEFKQGHYAETEPLYRRSLTIREQKLESDNPDLAQSLNDMAELLVEQGHYTDAEPLYKRALAVREKKLGTDDRDVAQSLNDMGNLAKDQGRYPEAEPLFKRALAIREKKLGGEHPDVAQSLNDLASLYQSQGRYDEAEPLYKRALAIREKKLGPDHLDVARSLNNLATLYHAQGFYEDTIPLFKRSISIREKNLGADSPIVATAMSNLAAVYLMLGHYDEAEPLFKRCLAIRQQKLGPEHPDVAYALSNLGELYKVQGNFDEAEPLILRSLEIREKLLGSDHPLVAFTLNNLADLYRMEGRYPESEWMGKRALKMRETKLGPDHPIVAQSLNGLAVVYKEEGHYEEAEPLYKRALAIREHKFGQENPDVAQSLGNLADLYYAMGRYDLAEPLCVRSVSVSEKVKGPKHPDTAVALNNLARLYCALNRYEEARPLYERSLSILESQLPADHPQVSITVDNLAELYRMEERFPQAERLYKRNLHNTEAKYVQGQLDPFAVAVAQQRFQLIPFLAESTSKESGDDLELATLRKLQADSTASVMDDYSSVLALRRRLAGDNDPKTAEVLLQIGAAFETLKGRSKEIAPKAYKSLSGFARALLSKTAYGPPAKVMLVNSYIKRLGGVERARSFTGVALLCVGNMLAGNSDTSKAEEAFKLSESCLLAKNNLGAPELAEDLLALSNSWLELGDYSKSSELISRATSIAGGAPSPLLYKCLVSDARLEFEQADYSEATRKASDALKAILASGPQGDSSLPECYKVLARAAAAQGNFEESKKFANSALALDNLASEDRLYCQILLGSALLELKQYHEAENCFESVLTIHAKNIEPSTLTLAASLRGYTLARLNDLQPARYCFGWALKADRLNASSEGLLAAARDSNGLAFVEDKLLVAGDKDADQERARRYALEASASIDKYIKTSFPGLSIGQQCAFLSVAKQQRDSLLSVCQDQESLGPAYRYMMQWKGLLLESLRCRGAIRAAVSHNPALAKKQEELDAKVKSLSALSNQRGSTGGDLADRYRTDTAERERLERELSAAAGVTLEDPLGALSTDTFRRLLEPNEAFIDIVSYRPVTQDAERYAAIAMKSGAKGEPAFFDLGTMSDINQVVKQWRAGATSQGVQLAVARDISSDAEESAPDIGVDFNKATDELLLLLPKNEKLQSYLGPSIKRIWLCPEGEFGSVPWDAVATSCDAKQTVSQVDSPREFAFMRGPQSKAVATPNPKMLLAGLSDFGSAAPPLPGAMKEISQLKALADQLHRDVDFRPQEQVTEENIKSELTRVSSAHIATHGFAAGGNTGNSNGGASRAVPAAMRSGGGMGLASARNPLAECGLLMAAPPATKSTERSTLHVLTADEIIGLDLSKCDLVTLSACQTGLGRELNGQGVIGLRSAIIGAGARSVLMSLWSVPDESTQELMKRFYLNLWQKKMSKQEALSDAQSYIRSQARWKAPVNWAAWVLVGE